MTLHTQLLTDTATPPYRAGTFDRNPGICLARYRLSSGLRLGDSAIGCACRCTYPTASRSRWRFARESLKLFPHAAAVLPQTGAQRCPGFTGVCRLSALQARACTGQHQRGQASIPGHCRLSRAWQRTAYAEPCGQSISRGFSVLTQR